MGRKFNIAIDIDGVLRDVVSHAVRLYNQETNSNITPEDVTEYNFSNSFTKIDDPVRWTFVDKMFPVLAHSPAFGGAYEALLRLKKYCNITILSKQPSMDAQCYTIKWLWRHGFSLADEIVFITDNKHNYTSPYDIVVDDYPENFRNMRADQKAVLINAPYNKSFDPKNEQDGEFCANFLRFDSLLDFADHFVSFLENFMENAVDYSEDGKF